MTSSHSGLLFWATLYSNMSCVSRKIHTRQFLLLRRFYYFWLSSGFYLEFSDRGVMADQEVWVTEVPQRGPGAEPRWGLGRSPQKL